MKSYKIFFVLFISAALLTLFSASKLPKSPLSMFLLKGSENGVEAYEVKFSLGNRDPEMKVIVLSPENQKLGGEALQSKNIKTLTAFSSYFGKWSMVVALPGSEDNWPGYIGGGIHGFLQRDQPDCFDNLYLLDRLFLSLMFKTPTPIPVSDSDKITVAIEPKTMVAPGATPSPFPTPITSIPQGVVRVEILNGCGITNAADWAARRLKGNGITIVGKDNADNFQYAKTIVRSAAGLPVALEEAVDRLGLPKESVEEITNPPASADVVVIVGKDFRKLKERLRDRTHH